MSRYFLRRLASIIPILMGLSLVTFFLFHIGGGDPAVTIAGKYATAERIDEIRRELGLDQPLVTQLANHLQQIALLEFGRSWSTQRPVRQMIFEGLGPSLSLALPSFLISQLLSLSLAVIMVRWRRRWVDGSLLFLCMGLMSISSLVYVLYLQYSLAFQFDLFPLFGWENSWVGRWEYLSLPILIFTILNLGSNVLFYRTALIEELFHDYVRTARAKGLSEGIALYKHSLRNALIPIIGFMIYQLPFLLLGALLIESFFGIPGLGGLIYQAIQNSDFPVIKAMTIFGALLYLGFQLLSDWLYVLVDPKIQLR